MKNSEITENVRQIGTVEVIIDWEDGSQEVFFMRNTILKKGREALAKTITNTIVGDSPNIYINRMLFGDGGTSSNVPKYVQSSRNGLFGTTRSAKPVIAAVDPEVQTIAIFTSVLSRSEANGYALNEMALQLNNGDLYSMLTFPDLNKTAAMAITFNWRINYL